MDDIIITLLKANTELLKILIYVVVFLIIIFIVWAIQNRILIKFLRKQADITQALVQLLALEDRKEEGVCACGDLHNTKFTKHTEFECSNENEVLTKAEKFVE